MPEIYAIIVSSPCNQSSGPESPGYTASDDPSALGWYACRTFVHRRRGNLSHQTCETVRCVRLDDVIPTRTRHSQDASTQGPFGILMPPNHGWKTPIEHVLFVERYP